jgi:FdrA protein
MESKLTELIEQGPLPINVGVRDFAESLAAQQVDVVQVDWTPPADNNAEMNDLLDKLL